jgi:hypothetical protein
VRVSAFVGGVQNSQEITRDLDLVGVDAETENFLRTMAELGDMLGCPGWNHHYQNHSPSTLARFLKIRRGER